MLALLLVFVLCSMLAGGFVVWFWFRCVFVLGFGGGWFSCLVVFVVGCFAALVSGWLLFRGWLWNLLLFGVGWFWDLCFGLCGGFT